MIETLLQRVVSAIQDLIPQDVLNLINAGNMKEALPNLIVMLIQKKILLKY